MRCYCCNVVLTPAESTRKFSSGEYADMCTKCLSTIQEDILVDEENEHDETDSDADGAA